MREAPESEAESFPCSKERKPFPFVAFTKGSKEAKGMEKPPQSESLPEGSQKAKASLQQKPSTIRPAPAEEKKRESASSPQERKPRKAEAPFLKASAALHAESSSDAFTVKKAESETEAGFSMVKEGEVMAEKKRGKIGKRGKLRL